MINGAFGASKLEKWLQQILGATSEISIQKNAQGQLCRTLYQASGKELEVQDGFTQEVRNFFKIKNAKNSRMIVVETISGKGDFIRSKNQNQIGLTNI